MQTHPTPLKVSSSSLFVQESKTPLAEIQTNTNPIPLSLSQDLSTAETGDKKLETRAAWSGLDPMELPESVQKQLNSSKTIKYFDHLERLIKDLKRKRTDIIMTAIYQNALTYDLKKIRALQKIAKGFIQSFAESFNFSAEQDSLERLKAIFQFFPSNSRVQFKNVPSITLGFEHIASVAQWFPKDKTVIYLYDNEAQELPDLIGGLDGFTTLDLSNCENLRSFHSIGLCKTLKYLKGTGLSKLETLAGIEACKELEAVELNSLTVLKDISALVECCKLKKINFSACTALEDINSLGQCKDLEELNLSGCVGLKNISALAECSNIREIQLPLDRIDLKDQLPVDLHPFVKFRWVCLN